MINRACVACYALLSLLLSNATSFAQPHSFSRSQFPNFQQELIFERYYTKNGLPDDYVRSLFQDKTGYVWIGTMNGLARYDGKSFETHRSILSAPLLDFSVYCIEEDNNNNLWVGTTKGVSKIDKFTKQVTNFDTLQRYQEFSLMDQVTSLQFDKDNCLWIGSPRGLLRFDTLQNAFKRLEPQMFGRPIEKIMRANHSGFMWVVTDLQLIRYHITDGSYEMFDLDLKSNAYGKKVWSLFEHEDGSLYIGTATQGVMILKYDREKKTYNQAEPLHFASPVMLEKDLEVFDIKQAKDKIIWFATNRGLLKLEKKADSNLALSQFIHHPSSAKSISHNSVYTLLIDESNVLWCGTESGLNKLDLNILQFGFYSFINQWSEDLLRCVSSNGSGSIWLGTSANGVIKFDVGTSDGHQDRIRTENPLFNKCRALFVDSLENNMWLGTLGGLFLFDLSNMGAVKTIINDQVIFAILRDRNGDIWAGSNDGLFKFSSSGEPQIIDVQNRKLTSIPGSVRSLFEDANGNIWVGYHNKNAGVYLSRHGMYRSISEDQNGNSVVGSVVHAITSYPANTIWLGSDQGLNRIVIHEEENGNFSYQISNHLTHPNIPAISISSIISDSNGNLWTGTMAGLIKYNTLTNNVQHFLNNLSFLPRSFTQMSEDKFVFGTSDGFILFDPAAVRTASPLPKVIITSLKLFNKEVEIGDYIRGQQVLKKSIANTQKIILNHRNNFFTLEFSGLHFAAPDQNLYAYTLEGFDAEWIFTDAKNNHATYTNLSPGTYTFRVKAANSLGQWNEQYETLKVTVLPPFWLSWWVKIVYVGVFFLIIGLIIRYYFLFARQKHLLSLERINRENLEMINKMKEDFFTEVSHEFKTPLTLIIGPVEELLSSKGPKLPFEVKSKLSIARKNCNRMLGLLNELLEMRKIEHGIEEMHYDHIDIVELIDNLLVEFKPMFEKKNITYVLESCTAQTMISIDKVKIEKLFSNLIANSVKFACDPAYLKIAISPDYASSQNGRAGGFLKIEVTDNGIGIPQENQSKIFSLYFSGGDHTGTGIGLALSKKIVELHEGYISFKSIPHVSTTFTVGLPIKRMVTEERSLTSSTPSLNSDLHVGSPPDEVIDLTNDRFSQTSTKTCYNMVIVEDNSSVRQYLYDLFKNDYAVTCLENGVEALDFVSNNPIDLIVSDVKMPLMDGVELCKQVKTNSSTARIPFILLTAMTSEEQIVNGLTSGADDYIAKPFHPEVLKLKVKQLISTYSEQSQYLLQNGVVPTNHHIVDRADRAFLEQVISKIEINLEREDFSIEELAELVAMSRSNLFRKVKKLTGMTPNKLLYDIRLQFAMKYLLEKNYTVSQISFMVGFSGSASLITAFKRKYGRAPQEFLNTLTHK